MTDDYGADATETTGGKRAELGETGADGLLRLSFDFGFELVF